MTYSKLFLLAWLILSNISYCAAIDRHPDTSRHTVSPAATFSSLQDPTFESALPLTPRDSHSDTSKHNIIDPINDKSSSKLSALEQALKEIGCVQWGEIRDLTPRIVEIAKFMRNPGKGKFILKPGIQILYLEDIK